MFNVGDRVAIVEPERDGKKVRLRTVRIDVVQKVTRKQVLTNHARFNPENGFQTGELAPAYQIVLLSPEHEAELQARSGDARIDNPNAKAVLEKRASLRGLFPEGYTPEISSFDDGKVAILFRLTYPQAETLAYILRSSDADKQG